MITLIAILEMSDGIGDKKGNLLYNIPRHNARFKNETKGKKVIMGRKTWETFPKKLLKNRDKYILTRNKDYKVDGANIIHSIDEILELAKDKDVVVIGGGDIFSQVIEYAHKLIITHVHEFKFNSRIFFPEFTHKEWKIQSMEKFEETKGYPSYTFTVYVRK